MLVFSMRFIDCDRCVSDKSGLMLGLHIDRVALVLTGAVIVNTGAQSFHYWSPHCRLSVYSRQ